MKLVMQPRSRRFARMSLSALALGLLAGCGPTKPMEVTIEVTADGVVLNGAVLVTVVDVEASNGVIHILDGVLLPPAPEPVCGDGVCEDGEVCDIPVNTCVPGCKTDDDCDMDERCEFDPPDEEIGDCVPDDEGTGGGGGTGGTGGAGGDGGAGANDNNELAGAVGGCGCTVTGGDDDAPWLLLVAGLAVAGIRRRRRRQLKNAA